jgi:hypothetical protein
LRALVALSGAGCAVLAAPPSADRRHHAQLSAAIQPPPITMPAPRIDTTTMNVC